jgi:Tol biopolymer transport system component
MPAMSTQSAALLLLLAGVAGCGEERDPMGPEGSDQPASESVAPAVAKPEFLTAGSGPRILFSSARTGGIDIYRMAPDGTGLVRVTSFTGPDQMPAWSWNNGRIAMIRDRYDPVNGTHKDIYLMNADGTGKKWARPTTVPYEVTDPSWSKDGSRIAVSVWLGGSRGGLPGLPYLAIITLASGTMNFVSAGLGAVGAFTPSFDPTGKKIVYAGQNGGSLETINADGTGHTTLIGVSRGAGMPLGNIGYPVYSPDGKRIAFAVNVVGNWDLFVVNLSDGTAKRLTTNAADDVHPTWSADGSRLAFSSTRSGASQVWTMPSTGGTQVRVTKTSVAEQMPAWSH